MTQKFLQEINNPEHESEDGPIDETETKETEEEDAELPRKE